MEERKNPKFDLTRKNTLFFNLGLVVALALILTAFEWKFYEEDNMVVLTTDEEYADIAIVPPTVHEPPKPPPVKHPKIIELPEDEEIIEDIEFDFDNDFYEEPVIEEIQFEEEIIEESPTDFIFVETQPTFMGGGPEKFLEHIFKNIDYPDKARRLGIEGKVFVKFIIDKTGNITDIEVMKGIGGGCDEEAAKAIAEAPDWTPGKQRGRPVAVRMMVPINFKLSR